MFGTNRKLICDLVINTNLAPILHRFRDSVRYVQNHYIRLPLLCLTSRRGVPLGIVLRKILPGCQQMAKVPNGIETLAKINFNRLSRVHERYRRQTDRRRSVTDVIANVNVNVIIIDEI